MDSFAVALNLSSLEKLETDAPELALKSYLSIVMDSARYWI
jgi:hypothetical protein